MMAASFLSSAVSESINGLNRTLVGMKQRILGLPNSRSEAKQLWRLSDAQQNPPTLLFRPQLNHVRVRTKRSCEDHDTNEVQVHLKKVTLSPWVGQFQTRTEAGPVAMFERIVNACNQSGWLAVSSDDGNAAEEGVGATKLRN